MAVLSDAVKGRLPIIGMAINLVCKLFIGNRHDTPLNTPVLREVAIGALLALCIRCNVLSPERPKHKRRSRSCGLIRRFILCTPGLFGWFEAFVVVADPIEVPLNQVLLLFNVRFLLDEHCF